MLVATYRIEKWLHDVKQGPTLHYWEPELLHNYRRKHHHSFEDYMRLITDLVVIKTRLKELIFTSLLLFISSYEESSTSSTSTILPVWKADCDLSVARLFNKICWSTELRNGTKVLRVHSNFSEFIISANKDFATLTSLNELYMNNLYNTS